MDFYIVLGVERAATLNDIKRAYRRLARKFHPDVNPGDRLAAAQFREISEAYETLSDPDRRRRYDTGGPGTAPTASTGSVGFEGFDFSISVDGASASTFGDLFADILRQPEPAESAVPERGADLHQWLTLSFEEAMRGGQWAMTLTRQEACRVCEGTGLLSVAESRCLPCHGTGILRVARGHMVFSRPCAHCRGTGRLVAARCRACGGQQTEMRTDRINVPLPAGLAEGARIRISGQGHGGRNGGERGDLYVGVHVEPHPVFRREGDDLHVTIPVAVHEAALGAKVDVPSIDGSVRLRVPPGTQSGQRFRLRERGAPSARDGRRGDLVVEVKIVLPKVLDERSKELLREFGRINASEDVRTHFNDRGQP